MILGSFSVVCLTLAIRGEALTFSRTGRYLPNVKIAEEIDIGDVTFTTPPPTDSDRLASLTSPKIVLSKSRVIVPVVTHHRVAHPPPELLGHRGSASVRFVSEPYKNPKLKKWKIVPIAKAGNLFLKTNHGKVYLKPAKYRLTHPQRAVRPIYYLVGDDSAPTTNGDGDYESGYSKTGSYSESVKLYNEKDLQFVKPKKNPKTFTSEAGYNHKPDGYPFDGDETLTSENSEAAQTVGFGGDEKLSKGGDRVEFQMYGMDGPNSYKFGYDTGKGDNRHFRFEERDSEGKIRGHYGYMDNDGKMRIMKYEADPETGFHAGPVDYPPDEEITNN